MDIYHDIGLVEGQKIRGLLQSAGRDPSPGSTVAGPTEESQSAGLQPIQGRAETLSVEDKLLDWVRAVRTGDLDRTEAHVFPACAGMNRSVTRSQVATLFSFIL